MTPYFCRISFFFFFCRDVRLSLFFQGSIRGGATFWTTAPDPPGDPEPADETEPLEPSPDDAAGDETRNPTSESETDTRLDASAPIFEPASLRGPKKPPRRRGP